MPRFGGIVKAWEALAGGASSAVAKAFSALGFGGQRNFIADRYPDLPSEEVSTAVDHVNQGLSAGDQTTTDMLSAEAQEPITPVNPLAFDGIDDGDLWRYDVDVDWSLPSSGRSDRWTVQVTAPFGVDAESLFELAESEVARRVMKEGSPTFTGENTDLVEIGDMQIVFQERAQ